jgi:predicted acetyltransferase
MIFRFPEIRDEGALRLAHEELDQDKSNFLLDGYEPGMNFHSYLERVNNSALGIDLFPDRVPSTFLVLEISGEIVGRVSIRHSLNDWLAKYGGHVGYAVRPAFRNRGYAKLLLAEGLRICSSLGISDALLTCNDSNTASRKVIEAAGGQLENSIQDGENLLRRYWVPTRESLIGVNGS